MPECRPECSEYTQRRSRSAPGRGVRAIVAASTDRASGRRQRPSRGRERSARGRDVVDDEDGRAGDATDRRAGADRARRACGVEPGLRRTRRAQQARLRPARRCDAPPRGRAARRDRHRGRGCARALAGAHVTRSIGGGRAFDGTRELARDEHEEAALVAILGPGDELACDALVREARRPPLDRRRRRRDAARARAWPRTRRTRAHPGGRSPDTAPAASRRADLRARSQHHGATLRTRCDISRAARTRPTLRRKWRGNVTGERFAANAIYASRRGGRGRAASGGTAGGRRRTRSRSRSRAAPGVTSNAGLNASTPGRRDPRATRRASPRRDRAPRSRCRRRSRSRDRSSTRARRRRTGSDDGAAATARPYVPILFATSPFAAMRSAPTITRSTSPRPISAAAAPSAIERRVDAEPVALPHREARALQQRPRLVDPQPRAGGPLRTRRARRRARCRSPRTRARRCCSVSTPRRRSGTSAGAVRADQPVAAHVVGRERLRGGERGVAPPRSYASRPRATPHARLTAVGRARASAAPRPTRTWRFVRSVCAASATPNAPAAPSAGAPRTASVAIASTSVSTSAHTTNRSRAGSARWSSSRTASRPPFDRRRDGIDDGHGCRPPLTRVARPGGRAAASSDQ